MLRRVQQNLGRGVVRGSRAGEEYPGCHQGQETEVRLPRGGDITHSYCWYLHHNEPWLCRAYRVTGEPEGFVQTMRYGGTRLRADLRDHVGG